jgi:hypothetical protein
LHDATSFENKRHSRELRNITHERKIINKLKRKIMIKNYFKLGWRNITKHRFYAFVNVSGLFAGVTFALLIVAYVWGELQVNRKSEKCRQAVLFTERMERSQHGC